MSKYGIDAIFALYESKCILVEVSLATAGKGRNCMPKQIL